MFGGYLGGIDTVVDNDGIGYREKAIHGFREFLEW